MCRVLGRDVSSYSNVVVESDDGRQWSVGTDQVKRQLMRAGIDVTATVLWDDEGLSGEGRSILRALAWEPTESLDADYCRRHHLRRGSGGVLEDLTSTFDRLVGLDSAGRYAIRDGYLRQWIRRTGGRPSPRHQPAELVRTEADARALISRLTASELALAQALAFEPVDDLNPEYCAANDIPFLEACGAMRSLRSGHPGVVELDNEERLAIQGRALRRVLKVDYARARKSAESATGHTVASDEDAARLFWNLGATAASVLRALAYEPTEDPCSAGYRRLHNIRAEPMDVEGALLTLAIEHEIVGTSARSGRRFVKDRFMRRWVRGNMRRARTMTPVRVQTVRSAVSLLGALERRAALPLLRAVDAGEISRINAKTAIDHDVDPEQASRLLAYMWLDLGILRRVGGARFEIRDQVVSRALVVYRTNEPRNVGGRDGNASSQECLSPTLSALGHPATPPISSRPASQVMDRVTDVDTRVAQLALL